MEADLPLSAIVLFYLAVFPCLWAVSRLIQWLIRTRVAVANRAPPAANSSPQPDFSSAVYEIVTTRVA